MLKKTIILSLMLLGSISLNADLLQQRNLYSKEDLNLPFKISASFQLKKDLLDNYYLNGNLVDYEKVILKLKDNYNNTKIEKAIALAYYAKLLSIKGKHTMAIEIAITSYETFNTLGVNFQKEKYLMAKYLVDALSFYDQKSNKVKEMLIDLTQNMSSFNDIDSIEKSISILRYKIKNEKTTFMSKNNKLKELENFINNPLIKEDGLKIEIIGLFIKYYKRMNIEYSSVKYADNLIDLIKNGLDENKNELFKIEALQYAIESYIEYEKPEKAMESIVILKTIYLKYFKESDIQFADLYSQLSLTLKKLKNYEESIKYNLIALNQYKIIYGEESIEMINLYNNLSDLYLQKKDVKNAKLILNKSYELSVLKYGKYDFNSKLIKQNLNYVNSLEEN